MANRKRNIQMKFWVTEEENWLIDEKMSQFPIRRLGCAVNAPNLISDLGYRDGKFLVARGVRARRARLPGAIALVRHLQCRVHLRHRPIGLVGEYELELRPLRGKAYSCLLAEKALAFKVSRSRA